MPQDAKQHTSNNRVSQLAVYLGIIQFVFALGWTVYVIFLPGLLAQVGIDKSWVIRILILDQLVFVVMDVTMGYAADRVKQLLGRLGPLMLGLSTVSCLAFLLLPQLAATEVAGLPKPTLLLGAILLWAATSSALRAPPLVLLAQYGKPPQTPWLVACSLAGLALAGALSPYLGVALKNMDPRLPFAVSALVLLATVAGLVAMERQMAARSGAGAAEPAAPPPPSLRLPLLFGAVLLLAAAGFQVFFFLNAAKFYLRFAQAADLEWLMPVFWVGFNLSMFAAAPLTRRIGVIRVLQFTLGLAAAAALVCLSAPNLALTVLGQALAGAAWGCTFMSAITLAIDLGHTGREGRWLGLLFSILAVGTIARMLLVALDLTALAPVKASLPWLPAALWGGAAISILLLTAVLTRSQRRNPS